MAFLRKTLLATSLIGAGLASTTGAAFAHEGHHDGDRQSGVTNVDDTQTIVPTNVCGNNVPVNAAGAQVPLQDVVGNIPILSPSDDDGGNTAGVNKSCKNEVDADS